MEDKIGPIEALTWKLQRILNKFNRLEKISIPVEGFPKVTHNDIHVIQAIGDHQPMNVTQLAKHFGITKSAASQKAARLAANGFVQKRKVFGDERELKLELTGQGGRARHLHEQYHGRNLAEIVSRLGSFTLEQVAVTSVLLDVIEGVMDERLEPDQDR